MHHMLYKSVSGHQIAMVLLWQITTLRRADTGSIPHQCASIGGMLLLHLSVEECKPVLWVV